MSSRVFESSVWSSPFGKFLMGFMKLALASVIIALIGGLANMTNDVTTTIGNQQVTIPMKLFVTLISAFAPLFLIISGLKDMGVHI